MSHATVYRALVTYSDTSTGAIRVKIPSILGVDSEVSISYIGRSSSNDYWAVPKVGDQIVVTADDENLTNVFWVQTEPYNPGTKEPTGFSNSSDSVISFDNATRTFTIAPIDDRYEVWVRGVKYEISTPKTVTIPDTQGGYSIYFDAFGELQYRFGNFDLEWEAPVSYVYWTSPSAILFANERHGTTLDWQTHEYLHRTQGSQFASGFDVSDYTTSGTGSTTADGKISIANGTFFDEDMEVTITHSSSPTLNTWEQRLQNGAYIPVFYKTSTGWHKETATQYPVKFGTTYPQYNLNASSLVEMSNNRYGIAWVLAANNLNDPIISVMGQHEYANIADAQAALWTDVTTTGFPAYEFRPLWKIIFQAVSGSAINFAIRSVNDLRTFKGTAASGGTSVTALDNLVDVTLTSPIAGEVLSYDGSHWVNNSSLLSAKAPLDSPTFTGTVTLPATTSINSVSSTEISYLDGVTSSIQTQIDTKAPINSPTFTGTVTLPTNTSIGNVSSTELSYVDGVTSAIQTQINSKMNISGGTFTGGVSVTNGYFDGGWGITCGGGVSLGSGAAISNFQNYRALQVSTTTAWGGVYDNHSGYLINAQMPAGWTSALLQFRTSSDWGTYNSYTIAFQYGNVYGNGWSQSDARSKINVVDSPYGLDIVRQMVPRRFGYRMPDGTVNDHVSLTNQKVGFIAQELMEVLPDAVFHREHEEENEHGYSAAYSVDYGSLTAVLAKAIQELDSRLTTLEGTP